MDHANQLPGGFPPPPMAPPPSKGLFSFSPVLLSALVFPGAGQLMQRRWVAAAAYALAYTIFFLWFLVEVWAVLKAYYALGFDFMNATGQAPSLTALLLPFSASMAVYVACLIDATVASWRKPKTRL